MLAEEDETNDDDNMYNNNNNNNSIYKPKKLVIESLEDTDLNIDDLFS